MGVRFPSVFAINGGAANVAINAETAIAFTPPLTLPLDGATVFIFWYMTHTIGTAATSTQYQIRRGVGTSGAAVNASGIAFPATAGQKVFHSGCYFDTPGAVTGIQYSLTCFDPGSTGLGAVQDSVMLVFAL